MSEPAVAPDRGGITVFQGSTSNQPPRQVNAIVRRRREQMEPSFRELLDAADDPVHAECDPSLDWTAMQARVAAIKPVLEHIAGRSFVQDKNVQDASFLTDLSIQRPGTLPNHIDTVFAVRFSNFGKLFTTWSHCESEVLPPTVIDELIAAVSNAGFKYVPTLALDSPYTGRHPAFIGSSWWIRFFDYV